MSSVVDQMLQKYTVATQEDAAQAFTRPHQPALPRGDQCVL